MCVVVFSLSLSLFLLVENDLFGTKVRHEEEEEELHNPPSGFFEESATLVSSSVFVLLFYRPRKDVHAHAMTHARRELFSEYMGI